MKLLSVILSVVVPLALSLPASAVENAFGRSVPGLWVSPQGGVVSTTPGFNFSFVPVGYMGSLGGARVAPLAGQLVANAESNVSLNMFVPQVVYKTETTHVSFASTAYLAVNWLGVNGSLQANGLSRDFNSISRGLWDFPFSPLTVGIHFSENNNLAIDTKIFAPIGEWKFANPSNLGMNEWTVTPNIAHTYFWKKRGIEFDNYIAFDIYSQNPVTKYTSGTMFHWDGMIIQYLSEKFGFGAIVGNQTQITKDHGGLANRLNGFQGGAWGAGPMLLYVAKAKDPGMILQLRWVPEFAVTNLMKGNTLLFGITWKL